MNKTLTYLCTLGAAVSSMLTSCSHQEIITPEKTTPSYVALEVNSGRVLYASNSNLKRPIGMLANLATAVVVMDWVKAYQVDMNRLITVPAGAVAWQRTNLLRLRAGDSISVRDAIYSALMWDDSACATTLAYACGSNLSTSNPEGAFIAQMNNLARRLGMTSTVFKGTNGAVITQSSARDMALLGMYAINDTDLMAITAQTGCIVTIHTPSGTRRQTIRNNNKLLSGSGHVDGLKVGQSRSAGSCLMVTARRASVKRINPATGKEATFAQRLLVVMLGMPSSNTRYKEAARFLRDGWNAWDAWLPTNDYLDRTKFIILPN
ncbi:MAG: D-alanyl-D-alanine carboxypeptidase [Akkermansia sp.]|nr:D-alanyl-D-alanine carboxypeptidase [Akkermansia sp.]